MPKPTGSLTDHKNSTPVIEWFTATLQGKAKFSPNYGDKTEFKDDSSYGGGGSIQKSIWTPSENDGFKISGTNGKGHEGNFEIRDINTSRWMPASLFNGFAFEVHQNSDSKHAMYMDRYCPVFINKSSSSYRFWGCASSDGKMDKYKGYRFLHFNSDSNINTIRSWGPDWLLYGFIFHIQNNSGTGSDSSTVYIYNLKVYHKGDSDSSKYRMFLPKKRTLSQRNQTYPGFK